MEVRPYNSKRRTEQYTRELVKWGKLRDSHLSEQERLNNLIEKPSCKADRDRNFGICPKRCSRGTRRICPIDEMEDNLDMPYEKFPINNEGDILLICNPKSFRYQHAIKDNTIKGDRFKGEPCIVSTVLDEGYDDFPAPEYIICATTSDNNDLWISNYDICPDSPDYNPSHDILPFTFIPHPNMRREFYKTLPILTKQSGKMKKMIEIYYQTLQNRV